MAHIVILYTSHAYETLTFEDMFECAAASGNVGHTCEIHISGAGVTALSKMPEHFTNTTHNRNTGKMLNSLPLYDVENIYVDQNALAEYGIAEHEIANVVTLVNKLPENKQSDILISF